MNLAEQINIKTEHAELARKIYNAEVEFYDVVSAIMRGEIEVHGVDLQDMVNEALGDDNVASMALDVVKFNVTYCAAMNFIDELYEMVASEIENALTNIVREHYHGWGRD